MSITAIVKDYERFPQPACWAFAMAGKSFSVQKLSSNSPIE
jgi:hypothetical protein